MDIHLPCTLHCEAEEVSISRPIEAFWKWCYFFPFPELQRRPWESRLAFSKSSSSYKILKSVLVSKKSLHIYIFVDFFWKSGVYYSSGEGRKKEHYFK